MAGGGELAAAGVDAGVGRRGGSGGGGWMRGMGRGKQRRGWTGELRGWTGELRAARRGEELAAAVRLERGGEGRSYRIGARGEENGEMGNEAASCLVDLGAMPTAKPSAQPFFYFSSFLIFLLLAILLIF